MSIIGLHIPDYPAWALSQYYKIPEPLIAVEKNTVISLSCELNGSEIAIGDHIERAKSLEPNAVCFKRDRLLEAVILEDIVKDLYRMTPQIMSVQNNVWAGCWIFLQNADLGLVVDYAKKIGLNGGISLFGPGHQANATIGRALRLVVINCTGSRSGEIDKATLGHAGKYTWCITENEDFRPWPNTGEDRGFSKDANTVSVFAGLSPIQVSNHSSQDPENILRSFRDALFAAGPNQGEIVIMFCPEHVQSFKKAGWAKNQIRDFLYEMAVRTNDEWGFGSIPPGPRPTGSEVTHSALTPESFTLLVGGGAAGAFSCVIPLWAGGVGSQSVTKELI